MKVEGTMKTGERVKIKETTSIIISYSNNIQYIKHLLHTRQSSETFCGFTRIILTAAQ